MSKNKYETGIHQAQVPTASDIAPAQPVNIPRRKQSPKDAIVPISDNTFSVDRFVVSTVGFDVPDDITQDEWIDVSTRLQKVNRVTQWALGDLMNHAKAKWDITYEQAAESIEYSAKSLRDFANVARHVPMSIRIDALSFGHHQVIASLPAREQKKWLNRALEGDVDPDTGENQKWSVARLRTEIRKSQGKAKSGTESWFSSTLKNHTKLNRRKWNMLTATERNQLYEATRSSLDMMEEWGID